MAARRERERRRPTERRYRFDATEAIDAVVGPDDEALDGAPDTAPARAARSVEPRARTLPRASARPFSDYRSEYAYVASDLRRIVVVVGLLLVLLIALYFVIAR